MSRALNDILEWTTQLADQSWLLRTWHKSEDAEKIMELGKQLKDACDEFMVCRPIQGTANDSDITYYRYLLKLPSSSML
jgi:hypothetical protein